MPKCEELGKVWGGHSIMLTGLEAFSFFNHLKPQGHIKIYNSFPFAQRTQCASSAEAN